MKHRSLGSLLAIGLILVTGIVRMPIEQKWTEDLLQRELLKQPLSLDTRQKLGQGFVAVTLGGLRSLVAGILHLRAYHFFENRHWDGVADTFQTIVQLAPNTVFYWDNGFWMMAFNAASHYTNNYDNLPPARAKAEAQRWMGKGVAFLEEGIALNPENAKLWTEYGSFYSNPFKIVDYDEAAYGFRKAAGLPGALPFVKRFEAYAMARSPRQIDQALPLVRKLREQPGGKVPTLLCLQLALECRANPKLNPLHMAREIFGDDDLKTYGILSNYYLDEESDFPMDGVEPVLRQLTSKLRDTVSELLQVPSNGEQALSLVRKLSTGYGAESQEIRPLRLALELQQNPDMNHAAPIYASWFPDLQAAYDALVAYHRDSSSHDPQQGIDEVLQILKQRLTEQENQSGQYLQSPATFPNR